MRPGRTPSAPTIADIMRAGGFDCVIGNPPYVRQESLAEFKNYFQKHYESFDGVADLYVYFIEKGVSVLKDGGYYSIIVSSSFLRTTFAENLRRFLKKSAAVLRIVDFGGLAVFTNAKDTYVCVPLLAKVSQPAPVEICRVNALDFEDLDTYVSKHRYLISDDNLNDAAWTTRNSAETALFAKIKGHGQPLGKYVEGRLFYGIKTGLNEAFLIDSATRRSLIARHRKSAEVIKPVLGGEDIRRWSFHQKDQWLIFTRRGIDIDFYPAIRDYLARCKADLMPKTLSTEKRGRKPGHYRWFEIQDDVAYFEVFDGPKIIFPDIAKAPRFSLDTEGHYLLNTAYCIGTGDLYLLGILNSSLFWFAISNISIPFGVRAGKYRFRLIYQYMEKVPIRTINFSDPADKARHDRLVVLVERMLELNRRKHSGKAAPSELDRVEGEIASTDAEIDNLVYELYGITEEEQRIIEGD